MSHGERGGGPKSATYYLNGPLSHCLHSHLSELFAKCRISADTIFVYGKKCYTIFFEKDSRLWLRYSIAQWWVFDWIFGGTNQLDDQTNCEKFFFKSKSEDNREGWGLGKIDI